MTAASKSRADKRTELLRSVDTYANEHLDGFLHSRGNARQVNEQKLRKTLTDNAATQFGHERNFAAALTACDLTEAYRRNVPLSVYEDYSRFIDQIASGERRILTTDDVEYFAGTSGTTGTPKLIPKTDTQRRRAANFIGVVGRASANRFVPHAEPLQFGVNLLSMRQQPGRSYGSLPIGCSTIGAAQGFREYVPLLWTSPFAAYENGDVQTAHYLHALFGLQCPDAGYLEAVFPTQLLGWVALMANHAEELVASLASGMLPNWLKIDTATRRELEAALHRDVRRSQRGGASLCERS